MKAKIFIALASVAALVACSQKEPIKVSVIGASVDTFEGYIPSEYRSHYPREAAKQGTSVLSVEQTWWWKIIYEKMPNAIFERNLSFSGSSITAASPAAVRAKYGEQQPYWFGYSYPERFIAKDGLGDPDVIFIHGGGNDLTHDAGYLYVTEKGRKYTMQETQEIPYSIIDEACAKADECKSYSEVCSLADSTFVDAYVKLVKLIQFKHPEARVVHYFSASITNNMATSVILISKHFGQCAVDTREHYTECLRHDPTKTRPNGLHPSAEGMQQIADDIYRQCADYLEGKL